YHLTRETDTEIIQHFIAYQLRGDQRPDLVEVFRSLSQKFDGAYNIVYLNAMGDMVVARAPKGFRPLCYAQDGPLFAAASESVALTNLGFEEVHDLEPGEMIVIEDGKIRHARFAPRLLPSHCFFEWIYFANVASTLDSRGVYTTRSALGRERGGAREVRVPVACPPIIAPCFYGIDMSTVRELFAPRFMHGSRPTVEEQQAMATELGADSLFYLPLEAVARCIGLDADHLCRACLTGQYPTPTGEKLYQVALMNRHTNGNGRTYEGPSPLVAERGVTS